MVWYGWIGNEWSWMAWANMNVCERVHKPEEF